MAASTEPSGARRRRSDSPWARKRRQTLLVVLLLSLLLVPVFMWRARLANSVAGDLASVESQGLPVTLEQLEARLPEVTETDNAARDFLEAAQQFEEIERALWDALPFAGGPELEAGAPLAPESREAMQALVAANEGVLAHLRTGASKPAARYIDGYFDGDTEPAARLAALRPLVPLLCTRAVLLAEAGGGTAALQPLADALALSRSLGSAGLRAGLIHQWEMEAQVMTALEWIIGAESPDPTSLQPFVAHFRLLNREQQLLRMLETEQGLFIARIRERRRRGIMRNLVVAAGVGDLNIRAYLKVSALALSWPEAGHDERTALEARYGAMRGRYERRPLLYATLLRFGFEGLWVYYRENLAQMAVTEAGLAVYRFQHDSGAPPPALEALVPHYLAEVPQLATIGQPVQLEATTGGVAVHDGGTGIRSVRFVVVAPSVTPTVPFADTSPAEPVEDGG